MAAGAKKDNAAIKHLYIDSFRAVTCVTVRNGGVAQLGEHLPCKQGVMSSNLTISTKQRERGPNDFGNRHGNLFPMTIYEIMSVTATAVTKQNDSSASPSVN